MRQLLRLPNCEWKSEEQRNTVLFAIEGKTDLLVALPTGSGKSIVPMLTAKITNKTFAIVVPFISLLEDWERRLKAANLIHTVFKANMQTFYNTPIILTTTDIAIREEFADAVGRSFVNGTFSRLVFDKVHEILVSNDFWACMQIIWKICRLPFPIIGMSGTIPVDMESSIKHELCLVPNTTVIRRSSNRPELSYILDPPINKTDILKNRVQEIIRRQNLLPAGRGLVFVTSVDDGFRLAMQLGCEFYCVEKHLKKTNDTDKKKKGVEADSRATKDLQAAIVQKWRDSTYQIMVATTAFAAENDYPHVRLVILATTPFDMCSAIQEMGRAGKDGSTATCYIIPMKRLWLPQGGSCNDFHGHEAMTKLVWDSDKCL